MNNSTNIKKISDKLIDTLDKAEKIQPNGIMLACQSCKLKIYSSNKINKDFCCPNCNGPLKKVKSFAVLGTKNGGIIITDPY